MIITVSDRLCYYRIDKIKFNFTLFTFFREDIIEDRSSIHAKFNIRITLVNDQYSSMTVNIELSSDLLRRYCDDLKKTFTFLIMDIVMIILLILSSITYVYSYYVTWKLAKVTSV